MQTFTFYKFQIFDLFCSNALEATFSITPAKRFNQFTPG